MAFICLILKVKVRKKKQVMDKIVNVHAVTIKGQERKNCSIKR